MERQTRRVSRQGSGPQTNEADENHQSNRQSHVHIHHAADTTHLVASRRVRAVETLDSGPVLGPGRHDILAMLESVPKARSTLNPLR